MVYNERSLYKVPGTDTLALLLRGVHGGLSVSMCTLPAVPTVPDHTLFSCRPGVGDAFMNLVEVVQNYSSASDPRLCNWTASLRNGPTASAWAASLISLSLAAHTPRAARRRERNLAWVLLSDSALGGWLWCVVWWQAPVLSTLPDAGSRTCAGQLPVMPQGRGVYLVGNQIDKGRDPVTLSIAKDGVAFDTHWAVRAGVPEAVIDKGGSCPRWKGHAKCCGYQYVYQDLARPAFTTWLE